MKENKQFPYTILQAIFLVVCGVLISTLLLFLTLPIRPWLKDSEFTALHSSVTILIVWGLACVINWKKGNVVNYSLRFSGKSLLVMLSLVGVVVFQLGINPVLGSGIRQLLCIQNLSINPFLDSPFTLFAMILLAPVLEELIFRGTILKGFLTHYSAPKAIVFSSILFGLVHALPAAILGALILGLFFGWVYYKTRSVGATILLHIAANTTGLLIGYLQFRLNSHSTWFNVYGSFTLPIVVASSLLLWLFIVLIVKQIKKEGQPL